MITALLFFMARIAREDLLYNCNLVHKTWRGHNRENNILTDDEKLVYLEILNEIFPAQGCQLHAFCLMSNHTHEIYQVTDIKSFSEFMRKHHTRYGQFFNKKHNRSGKVAEDRPKTKPILTDFHEMISVFYIHANPLRSRIVSSFEELAEFEWSTHNLYAYGIHKEWMKKVILPHWYMDLGSSDQERQETYRFLMKEYLRMTEQKFKDVYLRGRRPSVPR